MVVLSIQECQKCIFDAASRYKALREQHEKEGEKCPGPEGDGVLIFDEVRVVDVEFKKSVCCWFLNVSR